MTISDAGLKFIASNEGFSAHVYEDVAGFPTVGYGHRLLPGESFSFGVDEDEAINLLRTDTEKVQQRMVVYQREGMIPADCTQNQWDALADFAYNLGPGSLHTMLSHGWDQIPTQILLWDHAGGKVVPGLLARRQRELKLFQSA